jgi:hypothetical protein
MRFRWQRAVGVFVLGTGVDIATARWFEHRGWPDSLLTGSLTMLISSGTVLGGRWLARRHTGK